MPPKGGITFIEKIKMNQYSKVYKNSLMNSFKTQFIVLLHEKLSDLPQLTFTKLKVKSVAVINNSQWDDDILKADIRCFFSKEIESHPKYEKWMTLLDEAFEEASEFAKDQVFAKAMSSLNLV